MIDPKKKQQYRSIIDALNDDSFDGWYVDDTPAVDAEAMDVDEALEELRRRVEKSGVMERRREIERYTKPSQQRREERKAIKYRKENNKDRPQWRGGVET